MKTKKEAFVPKKNEPRGAYILHALDQYFRSGDAYTSDDEAIHVCMQEAHGISYRQLRSDMDYLIATGKLVFEGSRLYLAKTKRYEDFAAKELAEILPNNNLDVENAKIEISGGVRLNELQQAAIQMACSHRVSMILGGAGSGKTTLVNALTEKYFKDRTLVLAAPTGKAAQNLREHGCCGARTVHSALGKTPNEDFLSPVRWATIRMVVVDEASMLSIEMLAGILCKMPATCSLVLIGDPNQLGSVGSGNVIPDLLELGFPVTRLTQQYRQAVKDNALRYNVTHFPELNDKDDLKFDKSFKLLPANEKNICAVVKREAAKRYRDGEEVQVITGTNKDVYSLNQVIQEAVNPPLPTKPEITHRGVTVRKNDRVMAYVSATTTSKGSRTCRSHCRTVSPNTSAGTGCPRCSAWRRSCHRPCRRAAARTSGVPRRQLPRRSPADACPPRSFGSRTINGGIVRTEPVTIHTTPSNVGIGYYQHGYGGSVTINGGTVMANAISSFFGIFGVLEKSGHSS